MFGCLIIEKKKMNENHIYTQYEADVVPAVLKGVLVPDVEAWHTFSCSSAPYATTAHTVLGRSHSQIDFRILDVLPGRVVREQD